MTNTAVIQMNSGRYLDLNHLKPEDILLEDIAHHLSLTCRFGGGCSEFYSVAEHSIHVAAAIEEVAVRLNARGTASVVFRPSLVLAALLHDAAEAYLGDVRTPLKYQPEMVPYRELEAEVESVIYRRFGINDLSVDDHIVIKQADLLMLATEKEWLMPKSRHPDELFTYWSVLSGIEPLAPDAWRPLCRTPSGVRSMFLAIANALIEKLKGLH